MNANTHSEDPEESLTQVDVDDLTDFELTEVIPSCDFVVVGYDSSYSDDDVSTKRVEGPAHSSEISTYGNVRGTIVGQDAGDDRQIGFGRGDIRTSKSAGRIGSVLWVRYPDTEPAKTRYDIRFRALAGNFTSAGDADDPDVVDRVTDYVVDKYSFDDVEAPPDEERRVEDFPVRPDRSDRRAVVDVPVTLIVADVDTTDVDEVVERARTKFGTNMSSWYDTLQYRDDLPDVDADANRREKKYGGDEYLRKNTRYAVEDVVVETEPVN